MSPKKSRRQARRDNRARQKRLTSMIWAGLGIVVLVGLGIVFWGAFQPALGQTITVMADSSHVEEGTDPGTYNSDPPTSGRHYADEYKAGFYDEASPETQAPYPDGYLVHNLEHGYIIFWYNCAKVDGTSCDDLKDQIKSVLEAEDNLKVIAFPRSSIDVPVVLTSWGKMMEFEVFDADQARDFVTRNRNKAPEPNAP